MTFQDRTEAGRLLAKALEHYKGIEGAVYALPRGGVVLGVEIASALAMPLDLLIPRKVGHPYNPEYAICAVTADGQPICNAEEVSAVDETWLQAEIERQRVEAKRRRELYLKDRQPADARGRTAIIVDDGIATGLTMLAALAEIKERKPERIIVAIPVVPPDTAHTLMQQADELVALEVPEVYMGAVGAYYQRFDQVEDEEVIKLLRKE
jgi:putative phosphoribosyl transferase